MSTSSVTVSLPAFSPYQRVATGLLTLVQFTVILDFMIMSPLGAMVMPALAITAKQFGLVVSAYAFSAGVSGLVMAGFADRFDRKKLLLFFYGGFLLGTLWCGLATTFESLLAARVVTGLFGGVIGSIVMASAADLFPPALRGRVMGLLQGGFAASQVLGLPLGLALASRWGWHASFQAVAALCLLGGVLIVAFMRPVNAHLAGAATDGFARHLFNALRHPEHWRAFVVTALLASGGFMMMPFASAFAVHNVGIALDQLPIVYFASGIAVMVVSPFIGRLSDRLGTMPVFYAGSVMTTVMVLVYTHLGPSPLPLLIAVNILMFTGIFSRMVPWQATVSGVPSSELRGVFSAVNAALQQFAGGVASVLAGNLVHVDTDGKLQGFPLAGYVVIATTFVAALLMRQIRQRSASRP